MKTRSKTEAKQFAKAYSHNEEYKNVNLYIIYCNRAESYYIDTNSLIRAWEKLIGYYTNGVFAQENSNL